MNYLKKEYYFILFIVYISFIIEYDVDFFYFLFYFIFYPCYNIERINDILIASEIYQSVLRNCDDLNELPNDGENNDICGEELVVCNEYPMEEIRVTEENEDINSIENEFEPFVGQCFFLVKKRLSFSIKIMQIDMVF